MKNTLWRFGDSWATTLTDDSTLQIEDNHSKYVADYFDLEYKNLGTGGYSNLEIFNSLIENQNSFNENDIVLINFASVSRAAIVENGKISCTSNGGSYNTNKLMVDVIIHDMVKPISDILFYLIRSFIQSLVERNIRTYFFFLDEQLNLELKNELVFESNLGNSYMYWCKANGYEDLSPKGNVHYKMGSQRLIANKIIELIEDNDK